MCIKVQNCYRKRIHIYWINFFTSKRKRRGSCGAMCGVCIYFSYNLWSLITNKVIKFHHSDDNELRSERTRSIKL